MCTDDAFSRPLRIGIAGAWVFLVLPMAFLGYGSDGDAWLVARAAGSMWEQGRYVASRSTGFPLYEIAVTPLVALGGWTASNLLSLASGLALLLALYRLAARGRLRHPLVTLISIAFLPVVMKNAASTMDYVPGLALLLWAYVMLLEDRVALTAVLIGLATGVRPTNIILLLPAVVFLARARMHRRIPLLLLVAVGTGALAYAPALLTIGLRDSYAVMDLPAGTRALIGAHNALQVVGVIAAPVLLIAAAAGIRSSYRTGGSFYLPPDLAFHTAALLSWGALFLLLPDEPEYLLPPVLFFLLFLDRIGGRRMQSAAMAALLLAHGIQLETVGGESGQRTIALSLAPGMTVRDVQDRVFKLSIRDAVGRWTPRERTALLFGALWLPTADPRWHAVDSLGTHVRVGDSLLVAPAILDPARRQSLRARGYRLLVWRHEKWEYERSGDAIWQRDITVIDDLAALLGTEVRGRPLSQR